MVRLALELGYARRARRARLCADHRDGVGRYRAELSPCLERGELDVQPARELALVRPDPGHLGSGVARDHRSQSRARGGRRWGSAGARLWTNRHTFGALTSHTRASWPGILSTPRVGGG